MDFSVQLADTRRRVPAYGTEALTLLYRGDHTPLRSGGLQARIETNRGDTRGGLRKTKDGAWARRLLLLAAISESHHL